MKDFLSKLGKQYNVYLKIEERPYGANSQYLGIGNSGYAIIINKDKEIYFLNKERVIENLEDKIISYLREAE